MAQWLLQAARGIETRSDQLVSRILAINFASLHTSVLVKTRDILMLIQAITHILCDLASHPEYIGPLRDEVNGLILKHSWHKMTLMKMKKLDSVIKESLRLNINNGGDRYHNIADESWLTAKSH